MISFIAGLMIAITSVSYSYNPVDFYEEDGYLKPTGKFHGNAIVQMGEEYSCYGVHNINADLYFGDVNNDSEINIADVVTLNQFIFNGVELEQYGNADINEDEIVNIDDILGLEELIINENN